jgi:hypothetical protein
VRDNDIQTSSSSKASGWVSSSGGVVVGVKGIADALCESTTKCFIDVGELGSPHFSSNSGITRSTGATISVVASFLETLGVAGNFDGTAYHEGRNSRRG